MIPDTEIQKFLTSQLAYHPSIPHSKKPRKSKKQKEKKEKERKKRKEKQKGSNLNVYIAMARGECTLSQCANHKRIYTRGNGYNGFFQ